MFQCNIFQYILVYIRRYSAVKSNTIAFCWPLQSGHDGYGTYTQLAVHILWTVLALLKQKQVLEIYVIRPGSYASACVMCLRNLNQIG